LLQASIISSVGSRIAAMAARARVKDDGGSSNGAVPISCWSACATRLTMVLIDLAPLQLVAGVEALTGDAAISATTAPTPAPPSGAIPKAPVPPARPPTRQTPTHPNSPRQAGP